MSGKSDTVLAHYILEDHIARSGDTTVTCRCGYLAAGDTPAKAMKDWHNHRRPYDKKRVRREHWDTA